MTKLNLPPYRGAFSATSEECRRSPGQVVRRAFRDLPNRLAHTLGTVRAARRLLRQHPALGREFLLAVWFHDIGYAKTIASTGFHPLDGATFLHSIGLPKAIVEAVLWHGEAGALAPARLRRWYHTPPKSRKRIDAATYCDVTTDSDGRRCTLQERWQGIIIRRGARSVPDRHFRHFFKRYERLVDRFG